MHVVGNLTGNQIDELITISQIVYGKNVGVSATIQAAHDVTADKTGSLKITNERRFLESHIYDHPVKNHTTIA
jgi:hypothetical protein